MATPQSVSQPSPGEAKVSVAATIRGEVDTFLGELFNKLNHLVSDKSPSKKADIELHLCEIVESAVRRRRNDRVPFAQLPVDVVHCVFAEALDLERIYDVEFPIRAIGLHKKHLLRMRLVSVAWNEFLVSSPRYWPAINVWAHPRLVELSIKRARDTPLILFTGLRAPRDVRRPGVVKSKLGKHTSQVRVIRSDYTDTWELLKYLIEKGMPMLQAMELDSDFFMRRDGEPASTVAELPQLRDLVAWGWEPPAGAVWLRNLRTLSISEMQNLGRNTLWMLAACDNLRRLGILTPRNSGRLASEEELSDFAATITLPSLQELDMHLWDEWAFGQIVRRLSTPLLTRGLLRFDRWHPPASQPNARMIEDLGHFISPRKGVQSTVKETLIEIHWGGGEAPLSWFSFKAGCRVIGLPQPEQGVQEDRYVDTIANMQALLGNPPLSVTVIDHTSTDTFVRKMADIGVKTIRIKGPETDLGAALASIGSRRPNLPSGKVTDTDWPFESLTELIVEDITLNIGRLETLVGVRQLYLRSTSKVWLQRISLINCRLFGISLEICVKRLSKLGVALVDVECRRSVRPKKQQGGK
ncbi:hypothetical protein FRC04_005380 [Tulasnella sp. 424]|nr:hypothetical protein FRC04_005380 [Tulasnella sp. 424]KAG8976487.1 hypothetical protein FRC05_003730 [Tulasnella sp. 425]